MNPNRFRLTMQKLHGLLITIPKTTQDLIDCNMEKGIQTSKNQTNHEIGISKIRQSGVAQQEIATISRLKIGS